MAIKVAINGFGRIGRCVARIIATRSDIELVAINDTAESSMLEYITKYDTVHGTFEGDVKVENGFLKMGKIYAKLYSTRDAKELSFAKDCGAEIVLECTGAYLTQDKCQVHIDNGASKVDSFTPTTKVFVSSFAGALITTFVVGEMSTLIMEKKLYQMHLVLQTVLDQ